jgi:hypothetical protein
MSEQTENEMIAAESAQACDCCGSLLVNPPECDHGEWVVPCFECGARNIIAAAITGRPAAPSLEIVGLKWDDNK